MVPHKRLRVYALSGRATFLAWCRDSENDWKRELVDSRRPETMTNVKIDLSSFGLRSGSCVQLYDPWTDTHSQAALQDGTVTISSVRRSIVVRIKRD